MALPCHAHMPTEATEAPEEEEVARDSKVYLGQVLHLEPEQRRVAMFCCSEVKAIQLRPQNSLPVETGMGDPDKNKEIIYK